MSAPHPPLLSIAVAVLLAVVLVPVVAIDLRERRIPNAVTGPAALAAVLLGLALDPAGQPVRLLAGAAAAGFLLAVRAPRPSGLGLGDVKLAGVLGLCLGPAVAVALAAAFVGGSLVGVRVGLSRGGRALRATTVAFGPYLAGGAVVAFVLGEPLLAAYLGLLA